MTSKETEGRGKFIVVEGLDGSGKSTHAKMIRDYIENELGEKCLLTSEPGESPIGKLLRELFKNPDANNEPLSELLLFFANRNEHLKKQIIPALDRGDWVVCERFWGSSYAYQGGGHGIKDVHIEYLIKWITSEEKPALTLFLDIPVEKALERIRKRKQTDSFESQDADFFKRVRDMYHTLAIDNHWAVIDSTRDKKAVSADIQQAINALRQT